MLCSTHGRVLTDGQCFKGTRLFELRIEKHGVRKGNRPTSLALDEIHGYKSVSKHGIIVTFLYLCVNDETFLA